MKFGFYSDLRGIQFHEGHKTWMQALPLGKYKHPLYGELVFNEERAKRFAANVNNNVVGTALDIDYDHKAHTGKAAGWVQQAESRGANGLFIEVEFTPEAAAAIKAGEYRYFSPEFADKWTHPKSGTEFTDVLRGGGLTNRPFLKDIMPVNLAELSFLFPTKEEGVTPKELREALGLAETATDEEVRAKLKELAETKPQDKPEDKPDANEALLAELKKFAETNPAMKALADMVQAQQTVLADQAKQLTAMSEQMKLHGVRTQLDEATKGKLVLAPAAREAFEKIMLGDSVADQASAFLKLLAEGTAIVETGERGGGDPTKLDETDAEKLWDKKLAELMASDKLSYGDAAIELAKRDPKLFAEYREESTAFKA